MSYKIYRIDDRIAQVNLRHSKVNKCFLEKVIDEKLKS